MNTTKENPFELYLEYFENFSSIHTRKSYKNDITQFLSFSAEKGVASYPELKRQHVIDYRNWLSELGGKRGGSSAPKTIARKLAAISSYFSFLVEIGRIQSNPATSVKRPRREVKSPTNALSRDQVQEFMASVVLNKRSGKIGPNFNLTPHSAREVNHSSVTTTQEYDKRKRRISDSPVYKLPY